MRFKDARALSPKADNRHRFGVGKRCFWCGIAVAYKGRLNQPTQATREHVTPRSLGGRGGDNVAVACRRCNNTRSSDTHWVPFLAQPPYLRRVGQPMRMDGDDLVPAGVRNG